MNLALIGCGQIASMAHLPALALLKKEQCFSLTGLCDLDLERARQLATQYAVPHFDCDWRRLVQKCSAQAVSVCLPPGPNAKVAAEAVSMGLHVLCEKPPGRNLPDSLRLAEAAAAHPTVRTMIAFNRRFAPLFTKAYSASLKIGAPNLFYGRFSRNSLGGLPSNTLNDWLSSDGSHVLDLAVAVMGFPERIHVTRQKLGGALHNIWAIHMEHAQGSSLIAFHFGAGRRLERFEWMGPGYDVCLELPNTGYWALQRSPMEVWDVKKLTQRSEDLLNYGFVEEYRAFADAISHQLPIAHDFSYAPRFMQLVDQILKSSAEPIHPSTIISSVSPPQPDHKSQTTPQSCPLQASPKPVVYILHGPKARQTFFQPEALEKLASRTDLRLHDESQINLEHLTQANVLLAGWGADPPAENILAQAKALQLVVTLGASVRALAPELLCSRQVAICNTADAIAQSVAEHCLMGTLAGLRNLVQLHSLMGKGGWRNPSGRLSLRQLSTLVPAALRPSLKLIAAPLLSKTSLGASPAKSAWANLRAQRVGLVGWGHIAKHFANLLAPFDCEILVASDHAHPAELARLNAKQASLGEIFGSCKVISLHRGLTEVTKNMINAELLSLIRPGSVLVNTARGPLIEETALIARLQKGDIIAALDVFDTEPLPSKHPLRKLPNVILTPHTAGTTQECNKAVGKQALDLVEAWLDHRPIPTLSRSQLQTMS